MFSGFPFAPDYLSSLCPPVEEEVMSKKKGQKSKKRNVNSVTDDAKQNPKVKAAKSSSAAVAAAVDLPKESPKLKPVVVAAVRSMEHVSAPVNERARIAEKIDSRTLLSENEKTSHRTFLHGNAVPAALRFDDSCLAVMLALSKNEMKAVSGYCHLTLLKGHASLNGYALKAGVKREVNNSIWLPAAMLCCERSSSSSSSSRRASSVESMKSTLEDLGLSMKNVLGDPEFSKWVAAAEVLVLVQGLPRERQEWLVAAEDQSAYQEFSRPFYQGAHDSGGDDKRWWLESLPSGSDSIFGVVSAVIGESSAVSRRLSLELLEIPTSWSSSVSSILRSSSLENCTYSRTVICGAKGVGKSTCVRYMINKLLSKTKSVAIIDCDLGQPEFTVPGLLSLHVISDPILSPTHMHLSKPVLSYFIGDLTSKNEPELFAKALSGLMNRYKELQKGYIEEQKERMRSDESEVNSFSILQDKKPVFDMAPLPLVVNTDGAVRYMGAEVLSAVMEVVEPSHVMHISSEKDKDLPAVVKLKNGGESNDITTSSSSNNRPLQKHQEKNGERGGDRGGEKENKCQVFTLDPGRLKPSKIHSVDLRTLRIVSYFMRSNASLKKNVRADVPHRLPQSLAGPEGGGGSGGGDETYMPKRVTSSTASLSSLLSEERPAEEEKEKETKVSKKSLALLAGDGFFIRKGALVDTAGALACSVMGLPPLGIHFSEVVFQLQSESVPHRLMLAAMNASLVGITCLESSSSSSVRKIKLQAFQSGTGADAVVSGGDEGEGGDNDGTDGIEISCDSGTAPYGQELSECLGLGIVKAIDVKRQLLYLITPLSVLLLNKYRGRISLVRGPLQIPSTMLYAPELMSVHPYMSSEVTGEGSAAMKARNNVKRRSQHS